ncbi:hypothetical protein [Aequorivita sp. Q41]|uniref:hypothetical protein n=1 Tax=Aequorivita sp. Q41 TaxID=3153300 RepID=UPI003242752B
MGQKKDIGTLFKDKLNDGKKAPTESLWKKVNTTLDKEKNRKKRIFFYWFTGVSLFLLLGIAFLYRNGYFKNTISENQLQNNSKIEQSTTPANVVTREQLFKISKKDSTIVKSEIKEKIVLAETTPQTSKQTKLIETDSKTKNNSSKNSIIDETTIVSRKYYYYSSNDGKQLVTDSKEKIDSLLSGKIKNTDTLNVKKIDSLNQ